jgi:hypothetical protein
MDAPWEDQGEYSQPVGPAIESPSLPLAGPIDDAPRARHAIERCD